MSAHDPSLSFLFGTLSAQVFRVLDRTWIILAYILTLIPPTLNISDSRADAVHHTVLCSLDDVLHTHYIAVLFGAVYDRIHSISLLGAPTLLFLQQKLPCLLQFFEPEMGPAGRCR